MFVSYIHIKMHTYIYIYILVTGGGGGGEAAGGRLRTVSAPRWESRGVSLCMLCEEVCVCVYAM
jgi:hypothetical protein